MKIYIRQIKPYIYIPMAQGTVDEMVAVDGYDWVSEDYEKALRNEIVVSDSWSELIFKERYIVLGDGVVGEYDGVSFGCCQNCANAEDGSRIGKDGWLNCPMWGAAGINPNGFCHMWKQKG